jgi:hypothetical protein
MESLNGPQSLNYKSFSFCLWLLWTLNIWGVSNWTFKWTTISYLQSSSLPSWLPWRLSTWKVGKMQLYIVQFGTAICVYLSSDDRRMTVAVNHTVSCYVCCVAAKHAKSTFISHPVMFEQPRSFEWRLFCIPIWTRHAFQRPQIFYSLSSSSSLLDYKTHSKITITDHTVSSVGVSLRAVLQMSFNSFFTNPWSLVALHELTGTYSRSPFVKV